MNPQKLHNVNTNIIPVSDSVEGEVVLIRHVLKVFALDYQARKIELWIAYQKNLILLELEFEIEFFRALPPGSSYTSGLWSLLAMRGCFPQRKLMMDGQGHHLFLKVNVCAIPRC